MHDYKGSIGSVFRLSELFRRQKVTQTYFTANVGDSRIILCTYQDGSGNDSLEFKVDQLTEDHTTANDKELDR